jgi:thioredoxin reductase (NADPH)
MCIITNGKIPDFQKDTQLLIDKYGIKIIPKVILKIQGEDNGKRLHGFAFEDGTSVETDICFISLGMIVYNELAKQVGAELDERGFVKADESGLTSVPNLYVAGDLKANTKKQIYTAWDNAVNASNAINM